MINKLDTFYLNQSEPQRSCLMALRVIIQDYHRNISETVKYGMPCFCFGKRPLCYLWTDKKTHEPYVLFVDGNLLNFPDLETGSRSRMKILRFDPNKDIPINTLKPILEAAIDVSGGF